MKHTLRNLSIAAAFAMSLGTSSTAATTDLAFLMDESGSVAQADYLAAMDSLATALDNNIPTGDPNNQYSITVISFRSSASVDVGPTLVQSATDLSTVTTAIRNATYSGGGTNYAAAFTSLNNAVNNFGDNSIINMMTDGEPAFGQEGAVERDALKAKGWDALSFEAVQTFGSPPDSVELAALAFDINGVGGGQIITDPNQITNPLTNAFVLEVSGFGAAYDAAISTKIQRSIDPISPVPVPAALPLLLAGLGMFGALRLRKSKTAAA